MQYRTAAFLAGRLARAKRAILATTPTNGTTRIHSTSLGNVKKNRYLWLYSKSAV